MAVTSPSHRLPLTWFLGDTNESTDIFVHDQLTGVTARASLASSGSQVGSGILGHPTISAVGRFVAFDSFGSDLVPDDTNGTYDAFVHDRFTGTTSRVSVNSTGAQGNDESYGAVVSGDGRYIAFRSFASNLILSDDNNTSDIFVSYSKPHVIEKKNNARAASYASR